jgi:transcriptional regulator with GAF, ATPase, and Fis domain
MLNETKDCTRDGAARASAARKGVIMVFSGTTPVFYPFAFEGPVFPIGRADRVGPSLKDDRVSRHHALLHVSAAGWRIRDLGSRNGTFVDGIQVHGEVLVASPRVIRVGDTLFVPSEDIDRVAFPALDGGPVIGSHLRDAFAEVDRAAVASETLLVLGESGTGKELAAGRFHRRGPNASGPFVAVNCAAIPEGLAERLLFGAKKGAYSGATVDSIGNIQAADFGTLFLDEGGELDLQVQAKLLRVIETREVIPLGAAHGTRVSTRICMATHRDLRAAVAAGRFRGDLYHRLAPPEIVLPPLRARLDEVTQHVVQACEQGAPGMPLHPKLVESCLLRVWPGNVRELRKHLQTAASRARSAGAERIELSHLSPGAGEALVASVTRAPVAVPTPSVAFAPAAAPAPAAPPVEPREKRTYVKWSQSLTREMVERALAENAGSVARAAKSLGMGRAQLYRELARFSLARPDAAEPDGGTD